MKLNRKLPYSTLFGGNRSGYFKQGGRLFRPNGELAEDAAEPEPEPPFGEETYVGDRIEELMDMHHSAVKQMAVDRGIDPPTGPGSKATTAKLIAEAEAAD